MKAYFSEDEMREQGWLQDVFKAASARVDRWPEWKKTSEARRSGIELQKSPPVHSRVETKEEKER